MDQVLQSVFFWFIPVLLSLTVHEWAHAASAKALGDDTAERMGRLTLNPVAHVDMLGTVILPLVQVVISGYVLFGWAKPVPVNPVRFTRKISMRKGHVLVAAAGPVSNLAIALALALAMGLMDRFGVHSEPIDALFRTLIVINVALAVFNFLPIPPLDGGHVVRGLLPIRAAEVYERIFPYAPAILLGVILFAGWVIHWPRVQILGWMSSLTALVAG